MSKSPQKRITQSLDLRNETSSIIGGGVIPGTPGGDPPIVINAGKITSLTTNPISPEINSNFNVIVMISGNFSDGVGLQYRYTRVNGSVVGWQSVNPTTDNSATFALASGLLNGAASISVRTIQSNIVIDEQTLAFNVIGEESLVPFYMIDFHGGSVMQGIPWHGGIGSNYPAGGISFQDSNIISGDENKNITRSFFNMGTPFSTVARRLTTTRTLADDGITWEGEKTALEKATLFAANSYDGVQFLINSYYEPAYVMGFRKFMYWTPAGRLAVGIDILPSNSVDFNMNGGATYWFNQSGNMQEDVFIQGAGMFPSASWSALGPSGSLAPDGTTLGLTDAWSSEMAEIGYYDPITTGYVRPWTTNGFPEGWHVNGGTMSNQWNKTGATAHKAKEGIERDRRYSWENYFKAWVDSKTEIGDPVKCVMYVGGKVPYKTISAASAGETTGIDWGNLAFVDFSGYQQNNANGGWQIQGGTAPGTSDIAVPLARTGAGGLSPFNKNKEPRVGATTNAEIWTATGDKYFWDTQVAGWTGCGIGGFWIDASSNLPVSNPGFLQYLSNRNLITGSEAWPMNQSVGGSGWNRYFPQPYIGEMNYLSILNSGIGAFESRGWQNFNWTTGKQYHPRPDLGGIPGDGLPTPDSSDLAIITGETPGSGPEQPLLYIDGTAYDISKKPTLYVKIIFGDGGTSTISGWNASFRLKDPVTGQNVRRTSDFFTTPATFEADDAEVSTSDADYFDVIPRHYNELLMKNDLDKMIDYGYIPSFSLGYNDIDGQGLNRIYRNGGSTRDEVSLLARLQKYVNARLAGFSATDTQATRWLYLDLYNTDGSLITLSEVVIQSFIVNSDPIQGGRTGGGATASFSLNYYEGVTYNIDWRVYFKEEL
jgi:hypothetical protein